MPLPAGASSSSSSLRSRGQVPAHLALAPPSTPGNALGPDGQPLPSPSKGFPHPTYHLPAAPGAAPMKAAGTAGGPGAGAVNPKRETSGGKRTTTTTTTSKTSATSNTASERAAKRPTNLLTGMDLAVRSAPSSDPDDGRSPVRMSPSSPLFPSTSTPSPSPSPFSTPNLDANHSSANHHGRAKSSPGVLNDGSATHRDGRSRPNSWIVPSPVLASPSSRHSRRHGPSPTDEEDIARRVVSNVGEFGALGIVISDPDASSSSSASASATSSPSTSSLDTFSPFGGAFAAMTRSPKVGAQTYAAYPTPSNGAAGRLAAAAATESATPKANGIVGGYPASRPPQSSPLVRTYTSHRGSHSSHDALMSSASPPPPYPISPLNNAAYRKSSSARGGDTKSSAKSGFSGALRNALKRLYSDSPLATVPPGPDRTFYHQHQLSLVDPPAASSRRSMMSAIKNPLSFLSAPVDPFVDSHARSPPPPPSDGRFDDNTGASSAAYFEGSSRGTSPTSHSRRQTSGPQSTSRFEKTLLLASSTSSVGSAASSLPRSSSFGSAPGTPLGGSRNRRLPTPSNVRRLMSLIVVCLGIWTVVYLLLRLTPFGSSLSYPSSSSSDWANLDRHGIFRAHQTVAEKERMKTTIIKNGKQTIKTLSPKEEKDVKLRAVAKETAEKAKQIAALLPLTGTSRRFRYGANFQPTEGDRSKGGSNEGDNSNGLRKVAFNPTALLKEGRKKYLSERSYWAKFDWTAPKTHESLGRWEKKLQGDERKVRGVVWAMREYGARGVGVGLHAGKTSLAPAKPVKKVTAVPKVGVSVEDTPVEDLGAVPIALAVPDVLPTSDDVSQDIVEETIRSSDSSPVDVVAANLDRPLSKRAYIPDVDDEGDDNDDDTSTPVERRSRLGKRLAPTDFSQTSVFDMLRRSGTPPKASLAALTNFSLGSLTKWVDLVSEESAIVNGHSPQCGAGASTWMREYAEMHRLVSTGEGHGRFLTYVCENGMNCGGLGDRLLGMTSGFLFSLVTGRAFHAEWQAPIPMDVVFDSPFIDWSFSSFTSAEHPVFGQQELVEQARELDIIHFNAESTDRVFGTRDWDAPIVNDKLTKGMEARDLAFASPWIKFFTNRGMIYRAFRYRRLQSRLHALDLKPHTAFSCILSYLFTPKPSAQEFINAYTSVFSLPSVFSVGIQIRTGDMSMKDATYDKQNTVEVHKEFFQCADQLAETYALPDQKVLYYLVTDSAHLRQDAMQKLRDRVVISGLGITHIHQKSGHADGVYNAVIEEWMLAKTDYRVITQDSGFGKLASFAAAKQSSTVTIFPSRNLDVSPLKGKKARTKVDCRLEGAFVTFGDLSSEWSLG